MNEELDYAEMLEIPVNTVKVVKKKSLFSRKKQPDTADEIKTQLIDSVNERVGDYVFTEDLTEINSGEEPIKTKKSKLDIALIAETVAVCVLAIGIFATNIFMPNSAINTFINYFSATNQPEAAYTDFTLSPVVSDFNDVEITVSESGVISFTDKCAVYPVCEGKVAAVYQNQGVYTVEIAHTSNFSSVVTGVDNVYYQVGETVKSGVPVAYSSGDSQVQISMYNDGTLLNCYTLSGTLPVWNS
ncbi:MAG: hypothetical protein J6B04_01850 [Clostridia bacterium]|nr:hypothetical protein [Clostridia bacterium]